jgi:hypothetical protein
VAEIGSVSAYCYAKVSRSSVTRNAELRLSGENLAGDGALPGLGIIVLADDAARRRHGWPGPSSTALR